MRYSLRLASGPGRLALGFAELVVVIFVLSAVFGGRDTVVLVLAPVVVVRGEDPAPVACAR